MIQGITISCKNTFGPWNISPLAEKSMFCHFKFHAFAQNFPTCTNHNSINFCHIRMILDFLESSRYPLQSPFWSFLHLETLAWCKLPWQKVSFCWLLKWPIMYGFISFKWSNFWNWGLKRNGIWFSCICSKSSNLQQS